jgi:hypothetical protein
MVKRPIKLGKAGRHSDGDGLYLVVGENGRKWERHLGEAYSGRLLALPVHEITTVDVAAVLRPVWRTKPEGARKLYPAIRRVFERPHPVPRRARHQHGRQSRALDRPQGDGV